MSGEEDTVGMSGEEDTVGMSGDGGEDMGDLVVSVSNFANTCIMA